MNGFATCERNREACRVGLSGKEEREQEEPVLHVLQKRLEIVFLQVSGLVWIKGLRAAGRFRSGSFRRHPEKRKLKTRENTTREKY